MVTIADLIAKLSELPPDWEVYATKAGSSLQVWNPGGAEFAYVFTDDRPTKQLTDHRVRTRQAKEPT